MAVTQEVRVPDIGDVDKASVVEVLVSAGDSVEADDGLITLESDKASMEVPSPAAGIVKEVKVEVDDDVGEGDVICILETDGTGGGDEPQDATSSAAERDAAAEGDEPEEDDADAADDSDGEDLSSDEPEAGGDDQDESAADGPEGDDEEFLAAHASPAVRRLARELGVDLSGVEGTGRKGRITKEDLRGLVERALEGSGQRLAGSSVEGFAWPAMPEIDYSKFGETEVRDMHRIRKVAARNLHRSWLHVPHVTQHEEADVTELEAFRKAHSAEAEAKGFKLTPLAFMMKAAAQALVEFPEFNSALHPDGDKLIVKRYVHIGVAVDTANGLVVPVIRDVDKKGIYELAGEVVATSAKARDGRLAPGDFQGSCFTISSLGGIGGTAFTPIVNAPEVAILGVSRHRWKPVWDGDGFEPRLMMPLSLSYDHRVIDGAAAARFVVHVARLLGDIRRLLL